MSDAAVDAQPSSGNSLLDCAEGDREYFQRIQDFIRASASRTQCTQDGECTLWQPHWACAGASWQVYACGLALRSDTLAGAEAARADVTLDVCGRLRSQPCAIGVSCAALEAVCSAGSCTTRPL